VLPDNGPVRPKHIGVINFNILISVKIFYSVKDLKKDTSANSWFNNVCNDVLISALCNGFTKLETPGRTEIYFIFPLG